MVNIESEVINVTPQFYAMSQKLMVRACLLRNCECNVLDGAALFIFNCQKLAMSSTTQHNGTASARDPSAFLSEIINSPVTVKLNSGVVYKGQGN